MGNGMNKILPGLYVGNIRDAKDENQLNEHNITHILSIHDNAKPLIKGKKYLCIAACDNASQDLLQYFPMTNDFIHDARVTGGSVLIHCLAGVSRSVTVTVAYLMTVTSLEWRDALNAVRGARRCANPNFGFQRQLVAFQHEHLHVEKKRFKEKPAAPAEDEPELRRLIEVHMEWVVHGDKGKEDPEDRDTYPLPHNAYGKKVETKGPVASEGSESSQETAKEKPDSADQRSSQSEQKDNHGASASQAKGGTSVDDLFGCSMNSTKVTTNISTDQSQNDSQNSEKLAGNAGSKEVEVKNDPFNELFKKEGAEKRQGGVMPFDEEYD